MLHTRHHARGMRARQGRAGQGSGICASFEFPSPDSACRPRHAAPSHTPFFKPTSMCFFLAVVTNTSPEREARLTDPYWAPLPCRVWMAPIPVRCLVWLVRESVKRRLEPFRLGERTRAVGGLAVDVTPPPFLTSPLRERKCDDQGHGTATEDRPCQRAVSVSVLSMRWMYSSDCGPLVPSSIRNYIQTTPSPNAPVRQRHNSWPARGVMRPGLCIPGSFENFCRVRQVTNLPPGASVLSNTKDTPPPLPHQAWMLLVYTTYIRKFPCHRQQPTAPHISLHVLAEADPVATLVFHTGVGVSG